MFGIFKTSITSKVEKLKKLQGKVEVLKKEQKVGTDSVIKAYDVKQSELKNAIDAQIANFKAEIKSLEAHKKAQFELYNQERKVAIDKTINEYNAKIVNVTNQITELMHLIEAERKTEEEVVRPAMISGSAATSGFITSTMPTTFKPTGVTITNAKDYVEVSDVTEKKNK